MGFVRGASKERFFSKKLFFSRKIVLMHRSKHSKTNVDVYDLTEKILSNNEEKTTR